MVLKRAISLCSRDVGLTNMPETPYIIDPSVHSSIGLSSCFDLANKVAYEGWRDRKLDRYPSEVQSLIVNIADFHKPSIFEVEAIKQAISKTNMAFYRCNSGMGVEVESTKEALTTLGLLLGLKTRDANLCADDDYYSTLTASGNTHKNRYIPYTNKPINWHTDGYYNPQHKSILGMGLHCISPARVGGENALMDPEIAYILLREENPDFIRALMHPQAMEIPANIGADGEIRPVQSGPVFSLFGNDATLHMRYTARTRSVRWREDELTKAAIDFLNNLLKNGSPYIFRRRMEAGEGVICNNVLHNRSGFEDDDTQQRYFLRARYINRIST